MWEEVGEIVLWMALSALLGLAVGYLLARATDGRGANDEEFFDPATRSGEHAYGLRGHGTGGIGTVSTGSALDPRSADLEAQLARARAEVERLRERPLAPAQRPEDAAALAALEQRLATSEAEAGARARRVSELEDQVSRLEVEIDTREDRIALLMHPAGPHAAAEAASRGPGARAGRSPSRPTAPAKPRSPAQPAAPTRPEEPDAPAKAEPTARPSQPSRPAQPPSPDPAAEYVSVAAVGGASGSIGRDGDIETIEGIGPSYGNRLRQAGITTVSRLLEQGATAEGRATLAAATAIREAHILTWVNHADLLRVPGVDPQAAELLEAAGVDSPGELARRNAANLAASLAETNAERRVAGGVPSEAMLGAWIKAAAELPKRVEH